jgi:hypothetical protein
MAISQSRKLNMAGLAVLLLLGTLASWSPLILARWQMHRYCTGLATGTTLAKIQGEAEERGYELLALKDGGTRVHDPRSLGRSICDVHFGPQGMISAE